MNDRKKRNSYPGSYQALGIALGVCFGTAIGSSTNNIGLWLPIGMCLGVAIGSSLDLYNNREDMDGIIIKYNREAVCMGDDVDNNIYTIKMPSTSTLGDLMKTIRYGGNGNEWPITNGYEWDIYTNIGKLSRISPQIEKITYYDKDKDILLSTLGINWVYAARDIDEVDVDKLEEIFKE